MNMALTSSGEFWTVGGIADLRFAAELVERVVSATINADQYEILEDGFVLFRARNDYEEDHVSDLGSLYLHPLAGNDVCAPPAEKTRLGRFNPPRSPVLYLSTTPEVALAEVRALPSDMCTLARFQTRKPLKIAKLFSYGTAPLSVFLDEKPSEEALEGWLLARTANFVSRSVGANEREIRYRACTLMASAFREMGFDGLAYRTSFWSSGWRDQEKSSEEDQMRAANIVLFDPETAYPTSSSLWSINWKRPLAQHVGSSSVWRANPETD